MRGVSLFGDLPFMVSGDSADVWARQDEFRLEGSVGVPPDAFSETGQDWGLPVYRWDVLAERDFDWLRVARPAQWRTCSTATASIISSASTGPISGRADGTARRFTPADEPSQLALGETVLGVFRSSRALRSSRRTSASFPISSARRSRRLAMPGYKVFRWERHWHSTVSRFAIRATIPAASVATSGTHDTEPMAVWWEEAPVEERQAVLAIPSVRERVERGERRRRSSRPGSRQRFELRCSSRSSPRASNLLILPIQDVFGWRDRINQPATVRRRQLDVAAAVAVRSAGHRSPRLAMSRRTVAEVVRASTGACS